MACDSHGGIAKDGSLPWSKSQLDFKLFKEHTTNQIVVMGSKTWHDPIFPKPLKNRINVVVSRTHIEKADYSISKNIVSQIEHVQKRYDRDVFIIGGAQLLTSLLDRVETFYLSQFHQNYHCDTFIQLDQFKDWHLEKEMRYDDFTFKELRRN